jgi:hypothetical protein
VIPLFALGACHAGKLTWLGARNSPPANGRLMWSAAARRRCLPPGLARACSSLRPGTANLLFGASSSPAYGRRCNPAAGSLMIAALMAIRSGTIHRTRQTYLATRPPSAPRKWAPRRHSERSFARFAFRAVYARAKRSRGISLRCRFVRAANAPDLMRIDATLIPSAFFGTSCTVAFTEFYCPL